MKVLLLSLGILLFNIHLSPAQTKKIALHSHSGSNSSFTIHVSDDFGLGPTDYYYPNSSKKKKCPVIVKPIDSKQIKVKDSIDSIQFCTPLPQVDKKRKQRFTSPKSKPRVKKKAIKKTAKKGITTSQTEVAPQEIAPENKRTATQFAGFAPKESSESLLILCLSLAALLFFRRTMKTVS